MKLLTLMVNSGPSWIAGEGELNAGSGPSGLKLTGSVFLYTDNDEFLGNNRRAQDPVYALQTHLNYQSSQRWWVSLGAAFDSGGESRINGVEKNDKRRDLLYGISAGLPIGSRSSFKLAYIGSRTHEDVGQDTDSIALSLSTRF